MQLCDDNRRVFAGSEFPLWAQRSELEPGEQFVIQTFLDSEGRTLEAGCGGGRILLDLQARGFRDLHGFDYLQEFVDAARLRDLQHTIEYRESNASALDYEDASFDQAIYLQQVLCFLENQYDRRHAVEEAFRVLRPGGTIVASFLSYRAQTQNWAYRPSMAYLYCLRKLSSRPISMQYWPWLRRKNVLNLGALLDRGPYIYWMRHREAVDLFRAAGFRLVAVGSDEQVEKGRFFDSLDALKAAPFKGRLYVVCRKPS